MRYTVNMDTESHLFHDTVTGDVVLSAPKRLYRPNNAKKSKSSDPFSSEHLKRERILATYRTGVDRITAIENAFPVFSPNAGVRGYQEILVEGTMQRPFVQFSVTQITNVLRAYVDRSNAVRRMKWLKAMIVFKNEGPAAGASQMHAHSQLFGLSFVPERWKDINRRRWLAERRHGITSHALAISEASSPRTVYSDRHVTAYAHPAARFPYEVRILTRRKIDNVTQTTSAELTSLARALQTCLAFVRLRAFAYNFFFHDVFADTHEHFELRFVPRVNVWGGFELDAGIAVNPVTAEQAAEEYRQANR